MELNLEPGGLEASFWPYNHGVIYILIMAIFLMHDEGPTYVIFQPAINGH